MGVFTAVTKWATVRFENDASDDNAKSILVQNVTYKPFAEGRKIRFTNPDFEMDNDKVTSEKLKWVAMVPRFWKGCKMGCKNQKDCAENCVRLVHNGNRAYGSIDSLNGDTFVEIVPSGAGRFNAGTISHSLKNLQV